MSSLSTKLQKFKMVAGRFSRMEAETKRARNAHYRLLCMVGYTPEVAHRIRDWRTSKVINAIVNYPLF